jgi:asparagine synthase (glutamine-hydrolysing)
MCGIAGILGSTDAASAKAAGLRMAQAIRHRGPDDEGLWQSPDAGVTLSFRRLAIQDLTEEGAQPMTSASGRYTIVFNGEIYNFLELQAELIRAGVTFRGRSDTEVMLAACEKWGLNAALQKFNGMFAFALWDAHERTLHLARDRIGKKPLYVGWAGRELLFASELKAFHAHGGFEAAIDRHALGLYMRYASVPAPYSIYRRVWQLLPACRLSLPLERLDPSMNLANKMEPYWHLPRVVDQARGRMLQKSDAETIQEFDALLRDCVRDRMVSDVPLGAFLSGGIDSSMIVALMQQLSDRPVKTYCIGFEEAGYDEAGHAAKVAKRLGTDHHETMLSSKDALDIIPSLPDIYDEPFADASQIPTYLVSRFARQDVTVALTGDGGDEMLGGYLRHFLVPRVWSKIGWMPHSVRASLGQSLRLLPQDRWDRLLPRIPQAGRRVHKFSELMAERDGQDVYGAQIEHWRDPILLGPRTTGAAIPLRDPAWQPQNLSFAEQMIYFDLLSYLPNDLMVKSDRASMAASLECRAPLLDKRIVEYVWRLPLRYKVGDSGKQGKWLLRQALSRYLPLEMFDRPKQGFSIPIEHWLRGPLKDWSASLLDARKIREAGLLDPNVVSSTWAGYLAGDSRQANRLWTVLMFQAWHERWQSKAHTLVVARQA